MAAIETSRSLKERKKALLIESELNRLVMQLELENIRSATTQAEGLLSRFGNYATWAVPAVSVLGVFAGSKFRKFLPGSGLFKLAIGALPLALKFMKSRKAPP